MIICLFLPFTLSSFPWQNFKKNVRHGVDYHDTNTSICIFIYLFIYYYYYYFFVFCLFVVVVVVIVAISWAAPAAYGGSQARG